MPATVSPLPWRQSGEVTWGRAPALPCTQALLYPSHLAMADLLELLLTRKTVHDYASEPLPPGALERAFQAALAAPNHRMTEPWRFCRVMGQAREYIFEVALELKVQKAGGELDPSTREATRQKMLHPAELIVACKVREADPQVAQEDYAAVACAIHNFSLSLWAEGIGSKWSTGGITVDPRVYARLGVDPERLEIVGFVWVGIASKDRPKVPRTLNVTDVVREVS